MRAVAGVPRLLVLIRKRGKCCRQDVPRGACVAVTAQQLAARILGTSDING